MITDKIIGEISHIIAIKRRDEGEAFDIDKALWDTLRKRDEIDLIYLCDGYDIDANAEDDMAGALYKNEAFIRDVYIPLGIKK